MHTDHPCVCGTTMDSCGTGQGAARLPSIWMLYLCLHFGRGSIHLVQGEVMQWTHIMQQFGNWGIKSHKPAALIIGTGQKQIEVFHIKSTDPAQSRLSATGRCSPDYRTECTCGGCRKRNMQVIVPSSWAVARAFTGSEGSDVDSNKTCTLSSLLQDTRSCCTTGANYQAS